ncbi:MAG TPA: hypothetical protein VIE89_13535 [Candidatus Binatia bacterium]|jgi:hypothetical protein
MDVIDFSVFDCAIRVECWDRDAGVLLTSNYSRFEQSIPDPQISYRITREGAGKERLIARKGASSELARDDGEFLYMFEKDMTIETQKLRTDLYFLHAAVLELDGRALALVAPSGYGKSTTTWGLLHHGLKYLSDELAPICLETMQVHPFPHALCLKAVPPENYPLPKETIFTTRAAHVPTQFLPGPTIMDPIALEAIFFVRFVAPIAAPVLRPLGKGEAAARLFTNALNPLAHAGEGLDGAIEIASRTRCFEMSSANLTPTCELIKSAVVSID